MASKIEAAQFAVSPGSQCRACVVVSGHDFSAIRAIASRDYDAAEEEDGGPKGTLFVTPGSELEQQALEDMKVIEVSFVILCLSYMCVCIVTCQQEFRRSHSLLHHVFSIS